MITKKMRVLISFLLSVFVVASTSCLKNNNDIGDATQLTSPTTPAQVSYQERKAEDYVAFKDKVDVFAATLAEKAYAAHDKDTNFSVSPLSVFSALSLAAEGANGETRTQLLNALGVNYGDLQKHYPTLYNDVTVTQSENVDGVQKLYGEVQLSNSLWLQQGVMFRRSILNLLSEKYYAYSYVANFKNDNENANKALTEFIKKQTKGLIKKNYSLGEDTVISLVNTLYLKDGWLKDGDLSTTEPKTFTNADGSETVTPFLQGKYLSGRVYKAEKYSLFYTKTENGYWVKFILPNEGYTPADVFTAEDLSAANAVRYFNDYETNTYYYTRCLFPEFNAEYDENMRDLFQSEFNVSHLFDKNLCNFDNLIQNQGDQFDHFWCSKIQHTTKLSIDKTGIEGAAVTVVAMEETTSATVPKIEIYEDFTVNRAFAFIISSPQNITLFSGVVENV